MNFLEKQIYDAKKEWFQNLTRYECDENQESHMVYLVEKAVKDTTARVREVLGEEDTDPTWDDAHNEGIVEGHNTLHRKLSAELTKLELQ